MKRKGWSILVCVSLFLSLGLDMIWRMSGRHIADDLPWHLHATLHARPAVTAVALLMAVILLWKILRPHQPDRRA